MYLGAWPHQVIVFDADQEKIVDSIDLKADVPRMLTISPDRKKLYASTLNDNAIVTIDLATNKVIDSFSLNTGNRKVRLGGLAAEPGNRYLYSVATTIVAQSDHYDVEPPKFTVIDLVDKKISRTADFPKEEKALGYRPSLKVSPDGKYLYIFKDSILVFDTATFKLAKKIDLAKPPVTDMENLSINMVEDPNELPGKVIGVFNSSDPYVHREVFGIAQLDLATMKFDFSPIGPATATAMMPLLLTPDRKTGYTIAVNGTQGNRRCEFWAFDMKNRKLINHKEFDGRTRFFFGMSADGTKLFVYGAGYQIEVYDAKTFAMRTDVDVPGDITTNMVVLPVENSASAQASGTSAAVPGK
jgi:WD40 repeat protein